MAVDRNFSMSSFLALRYTEKLGVDFTEKLSYRHPKLPADSERILVHTAEDISNAIEKQLHNIRGGVQKDRNSSLWGYGFGNLGIVSSGM